MTSFSSRLRHLFDQRMAPGEGARSAATLLNLAVILNQNASAPERLNLHLLMLGIALLLILTAPATRPNGLHTLPAALQHFTERELILPGLTLGLAGLHTQSLPVLIAGLSLTMALFFSTRSRR